MAVSWDDIKAFVEEAFEREGRVERADVVDLAYAENANDDVIDALDTIGSRVFNTVEDTHRFLAGQKVVAD